METQKVVAQQTFQEFPTPGTGAVNFPGGPGNVPEMHYGEIRHTLAEEGRAERQVVILEPDHRWLGATIFGDHRGEGHIDVFIGVLMAGLKDAALALEV